MWNSIIAGGATGFTLAVRQGMAPALVSGGIGKVINRLDPQDPTLGYGCSSESIF